MAKKVEITTGDFLTIKIDENPNTIELTKWVCDKFYEKLYIRSAYGQEVVNAEDSIYLNGVLTTDLSAIRLAVGANW